MRESRGKQPPQGIGTRVLRDRRTRASEEVGDLPRGDLAETSTGAAIDVRAMANPAIVPARRRSSRARARVGSTAIRIDWAAIVITMKTPYAAKNPSVSSVRPNSCAMRTPTTAANPETTSVEAAVSAALAAEPAPDESVRLLTDAEAYGPCRTTPSGQAPRSTISVTTSETSTRVARSSSRAPTASWARISPTRCASSARPSTHSYAPPRAAR